MSLRIVFSTFVSYTLFVISKNFFENLFQEEFTVRGISAIAGVSERTIYKRLTKYDSKIRDFSKVSLIINLTKKH